MKQLIELQVINPVEIFTIDLASLFLGLTLLIRKSISHPLNGVFLIIIIIMVLLYLIVIKLIPIINHIVLVTSHILLPYFMIKIDAGLVLINDDVELTLLTTLFTYTLTGQFVHEIINGDSLRQHFNLRQCQLVI